MKCTITEKNDNIHLRFDEYELIMSREDALTLACALAKVYCESAVREKTNASTAKGTKKQK